MPGADSDSCDVKWCQEEPSHHDMHRRYLGEVMLSDSHGIRSVHLAVESHEAKERPRIVLTTASTAPYSSAVLTCAQADVIRALLAEGIKRSAVD